MSEKPMNRIYAFGVVALLLVFLTMFLYDKKQNTITIEENRQIAERVDEEEKKTRSKGQDIYSSLLKALEDAPIGFICWGDAEMVGGKNQKHPPRISHPWDAKPCRVSDPSPLDQPSPQSALPRQTRRRGGGAFRGTGAPSL